MRLILVFISLAALASCARVDDNAAPEYGDTGLPVNCRAYIQTAVNAYRAKQYTADETIAGIERNCGVVGSSWKNMRE